MLLISQQIMEEIKKEIKICIEANENNPKPMEFSKSSAKGKVHSNTSLPQETREKSNKYPMFTPKATRKRRNEALQGKFSSV